MRKESFDLMIIRKDRLIMWFLICILMIPETTVAHYGWLLSLVKPIRVIAFLYAVYLLYIYRSEISDKLKYLFLCFAWMALCTILNGDIGSFISKFYTVFSGIIIYQCCINDDYNFSVKRMGMIVTIISVINFVTLQFGGLYQNITAEFGGTPNVYFLGTRVAISMFALPAICITFISCKIGNFKQKIEFVLTVITLSVFVYAEWVSTDIAAIAFVFLIFVLWQLIGRGNIYNIVVVVLTVALVFISAIVVLNPDFISNFSWLIEGALDKSVTLTGRVTIWNSILSQMSGLDWLVGHGYGSSRSFGLANGTATASTHNEYLLNLYNYGVIGLLFYVALLVGLLIYTLKTNRTNTGKFTIAVIMALLITGITSDVSSSIYYFIFWTTIINFNKLQIDSSSDELDFNNYY